MKICKTYKIMNRYFQDVLWRIARKEKEKEIENLKGLIKGIEVCDYRCFYKYVVMALMDCEMPFSYAQELAYKYKDLNKLLLEVYETIEGAPALRECAAKEEEWQFIEENIDSMRIPKTKRRGRPRKFTEDLAHDRAMARLKKRKEDGVI